MKFVTTAVEDRRKLTVSQIEKIVEQWSEMLKTLKTVLEERLEAKGYLHCVIREKYNTKNKELRIGDTRDVVKRMILFKNKSDYNPNTEYGRFMKDFTTYSFDFKNKHDDANDSVALFASETIIQKGRMSKPIPIDRREYGI